MSNLASALLAAQKALPALHKDSKAEVVSKKTGAKFSYTYLSLPALLEQVIPVLNASELSLLQMPSLREDGAQVLVTTLLHATSGERFVGETPLILTGEQTPQTWGGAVTYARRYALTSLLGIAADEDDDAAAASRPPQKSRPRNTPVAKTDDIELQDKLGEIDVLVDALAVARKVDKTQVIAALDGDFTDWRTDVVSASQAVARLKIWANKVKTAA